MKGYQCHIFAFIGNTPSFADFPTRSLDLCLSIPFVGARVFHLMLHITRGIEVLDATTTLIAGIQDVTPKEYARGSDVLRKALMTIDTWCTDMTIYTEFGFIWILLSILLDGFIHEAVSWRVWIDARNDQRQ
jgi:hypothetical protein